jgi:toxin ParE1/3/4
MPGYRLSRKADDDLKQVYLYSFGNFGEARADLYSLELTACFQLLAEQPRLGRARPGRIEAFRVFFHGSHIIAYRIAAADILIQRVLDGRRDWQRILWRE